MSEDREVYDITVIGAGPGGCFGLFYAGVRDMRAKVIDSLAEIGGQLATLYPEKYIYDVPGFPKVLAKDLAALLAEQAVQFGAAVCLEQQVHELRREDSIFVLTTDKGVHYTKTVLIAAGAGAFMPKRMGKPEIDALEGQGVYYTVRRKDDFVGKDVVIVGGGDSAVDWALTLEPIAKSVALLHRRDRFRAHEDSVNKLHASSVQVLTFHEIKTLCDHTDHGLHCTTVFHNKTGEEQVLKLDSLILSLGFLADLGPIASWGLQITKNSIHVDQKMETNIPGVFAAGDICTYPGKLKLIATAVSEAAIAVNFAKTMIDPEARLFPGHTSDMDRFK